MFELRGIDTLSGKAITKTRLFKYIEISPLKFQIKRTLIFFVFLLKRLIVGTC